MFTDNIVHSMFAQKQTIYKYDENGTIVGQGLTTEDGMNVLGKHFTVISKNMFVF